MDGAGDQNDGKMSGSVEGMEENVTTTESNSRVANVKDRT